MWTTQHYLRDLSLLLGLILTQTQRSSAETTTTNPAYEATSTAASSSSYDVFSAIASAHPSANYGNVGTAPTSQAGANAAGASGGSDGSMNLSNGATIAIIVVVVIVVLGGASTAVLWYLAKKRQWEVRATLRRSARRVTGLGRPKTPKTPSSARVMRINPPSSNPMLRSQRSDEEKTPILTDAERRKRDIEQGQKTPSVQVDSAIHSSFDMDSPQATPAPGWGRVFAKR